MAVLLKGDFLSTQLAVFEPKMAVGFHGENPAVVMAEPAGKGWNIDARLDNSGGEKVPEIVMGNAMDAGGSASSIDGFLAFLDANNGVVRFEECPFVGAELGCFLSALDQPF